MKQKPVVILLIISLLLLPSTALAKEGTVKLPNITQNKILKANPNKNVPVMLQQWTQQDAEIMCLIEENQIDEQLLLQSIDEEKSVEFADSVQTMTTYNHSIFWSAWWNGDIIVGGGTNGSLGSGYGYYTHAATYDKVNRRFITAYPGVGVRAEPESYWTVNTGYKHITGLTVNTTQTKRNSVVHALSRELITKNQPEYYSISTWKFNSDKWYCSKMPFYMYWALAGVLLDDYVSYWATPDDLYNTRNTWMFVNSKK